MTRTNSKSGASVPKAAIFSVSSAGPAQRKGQQREAPALGVEPGPRQDDQALCALARTNLRARRIRNRHLPRSIFGEPAWDMLLALYLSAQGEERQTISRLTKLSGAPATTASRWIDYLVRTGLATRCISPTDKRVAFIDITERGRLAVEAYLGQLIAEGMAPTRS